MSAFSSRVGSFCNSGAAREIGEAVAMSCRINESSTRSELRATLGLSLPAEYEEALPLEVYSEALEGDDRYEEVDETGKFKSTLGIVSEIECESVETVCVERGREY